MPVLTSSLMVGAVLAAPAASADLQSDLRPDCSRKLIRSANHHRAVVVHRHGVRQAGRDIIKWGRIRANQRATPSRCGEVRRYRRQLIQLRTEPKHYPLVARSAAPPYRPPAGTASPSVTADAPPANGTLAGIASCESGGDPTAVGGPGGIYRGKYQFDYGTWASVGGSGDPAAASEAEQDRRAAILYSRRGASPWPVCGR